MGSIHPILSKGNENHFQSLSLVWLNNSMIDDYLHEKLRQVINPIQSFDDPRKCKKYLKSLSTKEQIVFLVNNQLAETIIERIHQYRQVYSIYIHITTSMDNEQQWIDKFQKENEKLSKIKGISNDLNVLVDSIRLDCRRRRHQLDQSVSISIFNGQGKSTSELNGKFVHSELSIDVLLRMKSNPNDQNELIQFCLKEYGDDPDELKILNEFEKDYRNDRALWWYTRESFLYRLLNKALRQQNHDMLFRLAFFIRDIEQQLFEHRYLSSIRLYRGQFISNDELKFLQNSIGQFLSMNSFLSTSTDQQQARSFLDMSNIPSDFQPVLFIIDADPTIEGVKPFADISPFSYFVNEQEILIMLGAIFELISIRRDRQIWLIQVRLCANNDQASKSVLEHMKKGYGGDQTQTDLLSFGTVLANMGNFDDAEKYFHRLLNELPKDHYGIAHCYHNLGHIALEKEDYQSSLQYFEKALQIKLKSLPSDHSDLAETYNSIGVLHRKKGDYPMALQSYNKALTIFQKTSNENDQIEIAKCFNNIGNIYQLQKSYPDALHYYQMALNIQEKHLPKDHPDLGSLYSNIAGVYQCLADHHRALEQYQISLTILEKSLPPQHPAIAMTWKNIAVVYEDIGDLHQALNYLKKVVTIRRQTLSSTHPQVQIIEQDMQRISSQLKRFT